MQQVQRQPQKSRHYGEVIEPIFVLYPDKINPGPNNVLGIAFPKSMHLLPFGLLAPGFRLLIQEYGEALQFRGSSTEAFYGIMKFTVCSMNGAYPFAKKIRTSISNRLTGACDMRISALLERLPSNDAVIKKLRPLADTIH